MNEISDKLDQARERLREQAESAAYLTVFEVAELARCEHKTVRSAISRGDLAAFKPVRKLLIREHDARAWIEARPARSATIGRRPARARAAPGSVSRLREIERGARSE